MIDWLVGSLVSKMAMAMAIAILIVEILAL
jgi:hypothetical protein